MCFSQNTKFKLEAIKHHVKTSRTKSKNRKHGNSRGSDKDQLLDQDKKLLCRNANRACKNENIVFYKEATLPHKIEKLGYNV